LRDGPETVSGQKQILCTVCYYTAKQERVVLGVAIFSSLGTFSYRSADALWA
jgi:hypothetical protein